MADTEVKESSLYQRIASGDSDTIARALDLCRKYNTTPPVDRDELSYCLADMAVENGDEALKDLANIHPDKDFIMANVMPAPMAAATTTKLNDCGCGCGGKCKGNGGKMNDVGNIPPTVTSASTGQLDSTLLMHGLLLSVYGIIAAGALSLFIVLVISATRKHNG